MNEHPSGLHLPAGVQRPDVAPPVDRIPSDYILQDVRERLLHAVKSHSLDAPEIRVDVAPVVINGPQGPVVQLWVALSAPSPLVGERMMGGQIIPPMEPNDAILWELAAEMWSDLVAMKAKVMAQAGAN